MKPVDIERSEVTIRLVRLTSKRSEGAPHSGASSRATCHGGQGRLGKASRSRGTEDLVVGVAEVERAILEGDPR